MQPNKSYFANGEGSPTMVPIAVTQTYQSDDKHLANAPQQQIQMVEATAYPAVAYPSSYGASVQAESVPQQYSYANQPSSYATPPTAGYTSAGPNPYTPSTYATSGVNSPSPYGVAPGQVVTPGVSVLTPGVGVPNTDMEFSRKLCFIAVTIGAMMLIIGIIVLATAPHRNCPEGCERDKCYKYHYDDANNDESSSRSVYECACYALDGTETCRNPSYKVGSPGYYHLVFGVLNMVLGGLAFFGGSFMVCIIQCWDQQRRNEEHRRNVFGQGAYHY